METQALEAIYGDDYKKLDEPPNAFEVTLVPEAGAGDDVNHICVALRVIYTPTYPEAAPELSVRAVRRGGLTDEGLAECETLLREAASSDELLGTAMVYMLVEKCIEWMVEHNKPEMDMHTEMMQRLKAQEAERGGAVDVSDGADGGGGASSSKLRDLHKKTAGKGGPEGTWRAEAAVDAEGRPTTFTAVTKENFAEFRREWEQQRAADKVAKAKTLAKASGRNVSADGLLTGRQLFERGGMALLDTDAGGLEEGEVDMMSAPREAVEADADGDDAAADGDGGGGGSAADAALLATIGDEDLFDDDEDLPDDEDE